MRVPAGVTNQEFWLKPVDIDAAAAVCQGAKTPLSKPPLTIVCADAGVTATKSAASAYTNFKMFFLIIDLLGSLS
jgi:hypothetical protein